MEMRDLPGESARASLKHVRARLGQVRSHGAVSPGRIGPGLIEALEMGIVPT